jgi:hypothetical protein
MGKMTGVKRLPNFGQLLLLLATFFLLCQGGAAEPPPRYLFFNVAPDGAWKQDRPETFTREVFDQVTNSLRAPENPRLRIGLSFIFSTLETPTKVLAQSLGSLLQRSEECRVPVLVALDGQNWWEHRPDLWNWWDPNTPGYNPANVFNVEWTGWSAKQAVKIGWRNWGNQLRVAPAPNLASPCVVAAHLEPLRTLLPIIVAWQRQLPASRKWLFGGVKLGWEAGIGFNAYYHPDGNHYLEQWPHDPSHDPTNSLDLAQGLSGGMSQLGYAALKSSGLKDHGPVLPDDLGQVTQRYLETLCRTAHDAGLDATAIYTHQGGNGIPWNLHLPFWAAVNAWSTPGWSFYGLDPAQAAPLRDAIEKCGHSKWAACEWWWGGADATQWEDHLRRTLGFLDCRFICIYNWNPQVFAKQTPAQQAVRKLVAEWNN